MQITIKIDNEVFKCKNINEFVEVRNKAIRQTYTKYMVLQVPINNALSNLALETGLSSAQIRRIVNEREK